MHSKDDIVIPVLGIFGTEMSTFISLLSNEEIKIGHTLQSCKYFGPMIDGTMALTALKPRWVLRYTGSCSKGSVCG